MFYWHDQLAKKTIKCYSTESTQLPMFQQESIKTNEARDIANAKNIGHRYRHIL
jgi:hypothetical protein